MAFWFPQQSFFNKKYSEIFSFDSKLTFFLLSQATENSVDPDQLASEEGNWSGSGLFVI